MIIDVLLREPLTCFTAVVDVSDSIFPGNLIVLETAIGGGLGRPSIVQERDEMRAAPQPAQ